MAIGGFVRLIPKAGAEDELLERALDVVKDVRTEPGNVLSMVFRDPKAPRDVFMLELFRDDAAVEAHRVATHSVEKGPHIHAILETPMEVQWVETMD
ncbi:MAG: antibiotic biosynthesis monooxygenase [Novosphingobium sp.]|nr:antibiotic biosynthesis monooxygenase [Novosphingobium sp.]